MPDPHPPHRPGITVGFVHGGAVVIRFGTAQERDAALKHLTDSPIGIVRDHRGTKHVIFRAHVTHVQEIG